jgi:hypothetical protein
MLPPQVTLLDPKKSMNLNIFLKQFRKPTEVIIQLIQEGDARGLGVEKLKGLVKLLPQQDEVCYKNSLTSNKFVNQARY